MKVLVTGGAGFIGSNLVEEYLKQNHKVVVVDNLSTGKKKYLPDGITFYEADIADAEFLRIVEEEKPDVINHHAAQIDVQTSIKEPVFDAKINILGTINVLEACRQVPGVRLVYASSAAVYGTPEYLPVDENHAVAPLSTYGISKHTPEHYIQSYSTLYGIPYTILRYANVYGKHQDPKGEGGVISILVDCAVSGRDFTIFGDGEQTRDFIHVEDLVTANVAATEKSYNEIVNISTNIELDLNKTVAIFQEVTGTELVVHYGEERKGDIKKSFLDNSKAKNLMGWEPKISLHEGLLKTYQFYKKM
ncbi:NAD-dependent epimerase/dehydratase family protein [Metabacillus indicus]|uniref:NAD-dependent epimerase/dehydratase family protein n=1 Tax=Metabacillus indicus TaxID=246786 RepID=UPI000493279A|nr:NAD-dependent epimerase/dehydratase family protein [Metabacillus indicus]KEZ48773.1 UDP-glucose 4-epimerase [Metabacillus indicus LMG 22858]